MIFIFDWYLSAKYFNVNKQWNNFYDINLFLKNINELQRIFEEPGFKNKETTQGRARIDGFSQPTRKLFVCYIDI